jgi:sugar phosphate isomerase/epimerase
MAEAAALRAAVLDDVLLVEGDERTFEQAKRLGFAGVEVVLAPGDLASSARLEALTRAQQATGLAVPSLVLGAHNVRGGLADEDPSIRSRAADDVQRALKWAIMLNADIILVPFFARGEIRADDALDRAAAEFRPLSELAGERGIVLCYEGTLHAERVHRLADQVGSSAFGCYLDLANAVRFGLDTATEIRKLGALIRRVHLKDAGASPGRCRPGLGLVDFAESSRALREIGYAGWLVLETPPSVPELVGRDLSFARTVFPELGKPPDWPRFGIVTQEFGFGEWQPLTQTCRRFGIGCVQLERALLDESLQDTGRLDAGVTLLQENGIHVAAIGGYRNLVAADSATRRRNIDFLAYCLQLAPRFGTSVVATETGTRNASSDWLDSPENRTESTWELFCGSIEELLDVAERHGSTLTIEAHVRNVLGSTIRLEMLLDRFPSDRLQVVLDPYNYVSSHLLGAQERLARQFFARYEHRFVLAHLKDISDDATQTIEFGTGVFPQRPYLEFLRDRRPDLPIIIEHLPLDHVPMVMRFARDLVA